MKFSISVGLILLSSILSAVSGNAQTKSLRQQSRQPICDVIGPVQRSTATSKQPTTLSP